MEPALAAARRPSSARWLVALLLLALPLLLYRLGAKDLWEASDGRPPEWAREMRQDGDWLVPHTNGEVDLTKPPPYTWLVALAFGVAGESEAVARVPSVLATLGLLVLAFHLARRVAGPRAGFLAGLLLLTQSRFLWQARLSELETLLALGVTGAYAALGSALERPPGRERTARFALGWTALGFAFAVKGPIAWLLVLPGIFAFALWTRRARALVSRAAWLTLPLALLVGFAWYAAVVLHDRSAADTFLDYALGRNVGHLRDPLYFLWQYPLAALPWTPLVLLGLALPFARGLDPVARDRLHLPLAGFGVSFVVLSCLHAKQTHYLIPLFPLAAVLAGVVLERALVAPSRAARQMIGLCALLVAAAAVVTALSPRLVSHLVESAPGWPSFAWTCAVGVAALLLAAWGLAESWRGRLARGLAFTAVGVALLEGFAVGHLAPALNTAYSPRAFLERAAARVPPSVALASSILGSHSDHLWYLDRLVLPIDDLSGLRRFFHGGGERYALVTAEQAEALGNWVVVLDRQRSFQKQGRDVALVASPDAGTAGGPR